MFTLKAREPVRFMLECAQENRYALEQAVDSVAGDLQACLGCPTAPDAHTEIRISDTGLTGWERFRFETSEQRLHILGSDLQGAIRGVYELSGRLHVNPFAHFLDLPAPQAEALTLEDMVSEEPRFRYRGWFFNDEDYITGWRPFAGKRPVDYLFYSNIMSHETTDEVIEAALRNHLNLLIPSSFLDIDCEADEEKVRRITARGLYVSQHHIEPLGMSHYAFQSYWERQGKTVPVSYNTNPDSFEQAWRHYVRKWAKYRRVVWQIGLRGNVDCAVWKSDPSVPNSLEAGGALISRALAHQARIIREETGDDHPVMTMTLWAEGAELYEKGFLQIPEGTIIVFANIPADQVMRPDFHTVGRRPGGLYGVYHHNGYYPRGAHLAQGHSPQRIAGLLHEVEQKGDTQYAITNVQNLRELVFGAAVFAGHTLEGTGQLDRIVRRWCESILPDRAEQLEELYHIYFDTYRLEEADKGSLGIWLDGDLREAGLRCADKYPKGLWHAYLALSEFKPDDKALIGEQTVLDREVHPRILKNSFYKWDRTVAILTQKAAGLPETPFITDNLLAPSRIMRGLSLWSWKVLEGAGLDEDGQRGAALAALDEAMAALDGVVAARALTEHGKFTTWYALDDKFDLAEMKRRTQQLQDWIRIPPPEREFRPEAEGDFFDFIVHDRYHFKILKR